MKIPVEAQSPGATRRKTSRSKAVDVHLVDDANLPELILSDDGLRVEAVIVPGRIVPNVLSVCYAIGQGRFTDFPDVAERWGVSMVLVDWTKPLSSRMKGTDRPIGIKAALIWPSEDLGKSRGKAGR